MLPLLPSDKLSTDKQVNFAGIPTETYKNFIAPIWHVR